MMLGLHMTANMKANSDVNDITNSRVFNIHHQNRVNLPSCVMSA